MAQLVSQGFVGAAGRALPHPVLRPRPGVLPSADLALLILVPAVVLGEEEGVKGLVQFGEAVLLSLTPPFGQPSPGVGDAPVVEIGPGQRFPGQGQVEVTPMVGQQDAAEALPDLSQPGLIAGTGQQVEVAAALVDEVGDGQLQGLQHETGHRLGEQLQVEGTASQGAGRSLGGDRVDEVLYAAEVPAHQEGHRRLLQRRRRRGGGRCLLLPVPLPQRVEQGVHPGLFHPLEDGCQGSRRPAVVVEAHVGQGVVVGGGDTPGVPLHQEEHALQVGREVAVRFVGLPQRFRPRLEALPQVLVRLGHPRRGHLLIGEEDRFVQGQGAQGPVAVGGCSQRFAGSFLRWVQFQAAEDGQQLPGLTLLGGNPLAGGEPVGQGDHFGRVPFQGGVVVSCHRVKVFTPAAGHIVVDEFAAHDGVVARPPSGPLGELADVVEQCGQRDGERGC